MNNDRKELIPELRFPEFVNNSKWKEKLLGEIGEFFGGGTPDTNNKDFWNGEIPWFTPTEIKNGVVGNSLRSITNKGLINSSAKLLPVGTILLTTRATIGDVAIIPFESTTNQGFQSLFVNEEDNNFFWYYWLIQHKKELLKKSSGSTFPEIGKGEIKKIRCFCPRKEEQEKIASCLSSLDQLISAQKEKLEHLKNHKKGLMQNLFPQEGETVPTLRFPEFKNDGDWEILKLGGIAQNLDSKRIPITASQREKGSIPYYGASGTIDYVKDYIYNDNLLCISEDGANLLDRNYPIAFPISGKTWVNNHAHVLKFESLKTQLLVCTYINSINVEDFLTGAAQPKLNRAKLDIIPIPLPQNKNEQEKIASCLSSLDDLISSQTDKIEKLQLHKKGLMQGLFPKMID